MTRDRPTIPEVGPLIAAVYARPGGTMGCCLHIMTEDFNLRGKDVASCIQWATEKAHADCLAAAEQIARLSGTQRGKVCRDWKWKGGR